MHISVHTFSEQWNGLFLDVVCWNCVELDKQEKVGIIVFRSLLAHLKFEELVL